MFHSYEDELEDEEVVKIVENESLKMDGRLRDMKIQRRLEIRIWIIREVDRMKKILLFILNFNT